MSNYRANDQKFVYSGKMGSFGNHTSGKTRSIKSLVNLSIKKNVFIWNEEEEFSGTSSAVPFTITGSSGKKLIIVDNPGQNQYSQLRKYIAKSSEPYNFFMLFFDSTSWNFSHLPFLQIKDIVEETKTPPIPIFLIITKNDLLDLLIRHELIDIIAKGLIKKVNGIKTGDRIPYYNRSVKKIEWIHFSEIEDKFIPFSILEQLFTNTFEELLLKQQINGLTKANIRIIIRSLLYGLSELLKSWLSLHEYKNLYPDIKVPDNLDLLLSNYRGTILESGLSWEKQSKTNKEDEIIFPLEIIEYPRVLDIFKRFSFRPLKQSEATNDLLQIGEKFFPTYEFSDPFYINNNDRKSLGPLEAELTKSLKVSKVNINTGQEKSNFSNFKKNPPKPRPKDLI